jgi:hypothetical protein
MKRCGRSDALGPDLPRCRFPPCRRPRFAASGSGFFGLGSGRVTEEHVHCLTYRERTKFFRLQTSFLEITGETPGRRASGRLAFHQHRRDLNKRRREQFPRERIGKYISGRCANRTRKFHARDFAGQPVRGSGFLSHKSLHFERPTSAARLSSTWANLIEMRDAMEIEQRNREALFQAIFILANPAINGALDQDSAESLKESLSQ